MQGSEKEQVDEQSQTNASTEEAEDQGLGASTEGLGGPDDPERQESGVGGSGGGLDGPTKDVTSPPGGGDPKGPAPGGVPKEGGVDDDADYVTDSATDSQ